MTIVVISDQADAYGRSVLVALREPHGTWRAYKKDGCKCDECRAAWQRYKKGREHARHRGEASSLDATGAHRRLQALMALGYSSRWLGAQIGGEGSASGYMDRLLASPRLRPATIERVKKLYDNYSMTVPPANRYTNRVRNLAKAKGFAPPLAWDEETIDDPNARPQGLSREHRAGYCHADRHLLTEDNTIRTPGKPNRRSCRACRNLGRAAWRARQGTMTQ